MGGKFSHGFVSTFITSTIGSPKNYISGEKPGIKLGRTLLAAVTGGTVSSATGGKFANGAITSFFSHLLNAEKTDSNNNKDDSPKNADQEIDSEFAAFVEMMDSAAKEAFKQFPSECKIYECSGLLAVTPDGKIRFSFGRISDSSGSVEIDFKDFKTKEGWLLLAILHNHPGKDPIGNFFSQADFEGMASIGSLGEYILTPSAGLLFLPNSSDVTLENYQDKTRIVDSKFKTKWQ